MADPGFHVNPTRPKTKITAERIREAHPSSSYITVPRRGKMQADKGPKRRMAVWTDNTIIYLSPYLPHFFEYNHRPASVYLILKRDTPCVCLSVCLSVCLCFVTPERHTGQGIILQSSATGDWVGVKPAGSNARRWLCDGV
jgi:hypothetical protein